MDDLDLLQQQYPKYAAIPKGELADKIYDKHYAKQMSKDDYYKKIGYDPTRFAASEHVPEGEAMLDAAGRAPGNIAGMVKALVTGVPSAAIHPIDTFENARYGIAKGTGNILNNTAQNIAEYVIANRQKNIEKLKKKGLGEDLIKGYERAAGDPEKIRKIAEFFTPSAENQKLNKEYVESLRPEEQGHAGAQLAQGVGQFLPSLAATSLVGAPVLAPVLHGTAENKNVFEDLIPLLLAKQAHGKGPEIVEGTKKAAGIAAKPFKAAGEAIKEVTSPYGESKMLQEAIDKAERKKFSGEVKNRQMSTMAAEDIGKLQETIRERTSKRGQDIEQYAPNQEAAARADAKRTLTERHQANKEGFTKEYNQLFDAKEMGANGAEIKTGNMVPTHQRGKVKPLEAEHLAKAYKTGLEALSGKKFLDNPEIAKLKIEHKVQDLVTFNRHIMSEAMDYGYDAVHADTSAKRSKAAAIKKDLLNLHDYLDNVVETTIPDSAYKKLKEIDSRYGKIIHPFRENTFLRNAIDKHGNITSKNIFKELNDLGNKELLQNLTEHPEFLEAMTKHDLRKLATDNIDVMQDLLKSDQGRALPSKVRQQLEAQVQDLGNMETFGAFQKQLMASELKSLINEPNMKKVLKEHPDLLKKLQDIHEVREGIKDVGEELKKLGLDKEQVDRAKNKLNKILKVTGLTTLGLTGIWKLVL